MILNLIDYELESKIIDLEIVDYKEIRFGN